MTRRRRAVIVMAASLFTAPAASAQGFDSGVAVGDVTPTSAWIWTRAPSPGGVRVLVYDISAAIPTLAADWSVVHPASAAKDATVRILLTALTPAHSYTFRFIDGANASDQGSFTTPPLPGRSSPVVFSVSGAADTTQSGHGFSLGIYQRINRTPELFNVSLGGVIYSQSTLPRSGRALTIRAKWRRYRHATSLPAVTGLRSTTALFSVWDDQAFASRFSPAAAPGVYKAGTAAFLDYTPAPYGALGLYRTVSWGRNAELFLLDLRSFRSAPASAACTNPVTGRPDAAPTAPAPVRSLLAASHDGALTSLSSPVSASCLATVNAASRTMLGDAQLAALRRDLSQSRARFKIILSPQPIASLLIDPYDRWEGYAAARADLLGLLASTRNVIVVSSGSGGAFITDVATAAAAPAAASVPEVVTGPAAAATLRTQLDANLKARAAWRVIVRDLFAPPVLAGTSTGLGIRCVATGQEAYAQVRVTATRLSVVLVGAGGRVVTSDASGRRCDPVTLRFG